MNETNPIQNTETTFESFDDSEIEYREELEDELYETICDIAHRPHRSPDKAVEFLGIEEDIDKLQKMSDDELDDAFVCVTDTLVETPDEEFRKVWDKYHPHISMTEAIHEYDKWYNEHPDQGLVFLNLCKQEKPT